MFKPWKLIIPSILLLIVVAFGVAYKLNLPGSNVRTLSVHPSDGDKSLSEYYQEAQSLSSVQTQTATATFLAVGDIMLSRNVAAAIQKSSDADLPFEKMSDVLKSTDFNFANLESPASLPLLNKEGCPSASDSSAEALAKEEGGVVGGHSMIFGAPCSYIKGLADYNFKVLNLANNHAFDQGLGGLDYTRTLLDQNNILHEGTGDNLDEAWQPAVVTANGIKICFIGASFSSINDSGKTTNNYVARIEDIENLKLKIENSKSVCNFTVVTMHAGTEYTRTPNQAQIAFAHAAINDGADMVIGAHPHWVQTIEKYCPLQSSPPFQGGVSPEAPAKGDGVVGAQNSTPSCSNPKYIFYSLGNFIFDQAWSQETMQGLTLKITLSKANVPNPEAPGAASLDDLQGNRLPATLQQIELIPVIITNSQPRPATADETKKILNEIGQKENILKP